MSVRTMARVWDASLHGGTELLMLLAIADFADDDGRAYPSVPTLAAKCRMKPRNANYVLSALKKSGELLILMNEGPRGTNVYRINLEQLGMQSAAPLQKLAPLQRIAETPATHCAKPLQPIADEPSLNHQETPVKASPKSGRSKKELLLFQDWLAKHPRTDGRVMAADDPIKRYAATLGMSHEFLELQWKWFSAKQTELGNKQKDWLATYRNSVRGNWGRLWFRTNEGTWQLTTVGKQVAIENGFDENMCSAGRTNDWTNHAT